MLSPRTCSPPSSIAHSGWCISAAACTMADEPTWPGWIGADKAEPAPTQTANCSWHLTQEWLATSDEPEARSSGGYWFHRRLRTPHPAVRDTHFQDSLLASLARFTAAPLD